MLDPRWVRDNADAVREAARRKRFDPQVVDDWLERDREHRAVVTEAEALRAGLREASKRLGAMSPAEREGELGRQKEQKARLKHLEGAAADLGAAVRALALRLPMPPAAAVPDGASDADNVELRRSAEPPRFAFAPRDHVDLGESLGILDIPRGVNLAGTRNYLLLGDGARLERAVLQFALDHMAARGFMQVAVPTLVKKTCMEGTGYFPGGEEQAYLVERDDLSLIGTSEVPLTAMHAGETLDEAALPLRRVAVSPCYRREAGTYGKDTKGLYRVHQFWKVEQVVVGPADEEWSRAEHERMLGHATDLMDALDLAYRVVNVCGGDLGQGQVQKFDIETWMPSRGGWGETHSASRFHDFQARRLDLRYRPAGGGKPLHCHTLNNTVVASPRVLICLLENHQRADGSVAIPAPLRPYLGGQAELRPPPR
jgi:seryl-tRNA synthetase